MPQALQVPTQVSQWRPLAEKYASASPYCSCSHLKTLHPYADCMAHLCDCKSFSPILKPEEILAEIWSESTGAQFAVNPGDPSWGLMQVTLAIASRFASIVAPPLRSGDPQVHEKPPSYGYDTGHLIFVPDNNVRAGSGFLAHLKSCYAKTDPIFLSDGSVNPVGWIAAYNEGEPNLWKKRPDLAYVEKFAKYMRALGVEPA